ncbi:MAG TPA: response regulator [Verrucomicrobia bacterium]|nr:response regulator [Verrucomicrobiota bacterium]
MKALIVEDDFTSRLLLQAILNDFGTIYTVVNGREAVDACRAAIEGDAPFDLICMDIMMPEMDGQQAVRAIREIEQAKGIIFPDGAKIIMTTALGDVKNMMKAFESLCDAYIVKPIGKQAVADALRKLKLID